MDDFSFDNPTDELLNILSVESTALQRRLEEIQQQIDTYEQMVKREETRSADLAADKRILEENFDTVPREDIRTHYEKSIETRFRLATMRGQLDQFKATQEFIEEEQALLRDVLSRIRGGVEFGAADAEADGPSSASLDIIRIVQAQENERRRLANQMHDGPAQSLTNFVLQAEICQRLFDSNPEGAREELVNLKEAASVTFQRVREFIADLRPMMLDDLGVVPTVRKHVESFSNKSDIKVDVLMDGDHERRLEEYQEVMLFRGIQDLMGHARDFADATEISLKIDIREDIAIIDITDNGRPFDTELLQSEDHPDDPRAQGLMTLRERFELIGGQISVSSGEGALSEIRIEVPIRDRA